MLIFVKLMWKKKITKKKRKDLFINAVLYISNIEKNIKKKLGKSDIRMLLFFYNHTNTF